MRPIRAFAIAELVLVLVGTDGGGPGGTAANPLIPISRVSLSRELVRMEVAPESLVVHGLYSFKREDQAPTCVIYFPFPRDSGDARPRLISAALSSGRQPFRPVQVDTVQTPWFLEVKVASSYTFTISVSYSQHLTGRRAEYPLTSRHSWFRPGDLIRIDVLLAPGVSNPSFTLPVSRSADGHGGAVYTWRTGGSLPDGDMAVKWSLPPVLKR